LGLPASNSRWRRRTPTSTLVAIRCPPPIARLTHLACVQPAFSTSECLTWLHRPNTRLPHPQSDPRLVLVWPVWSRQSLMPLSEPLSLSLSLSPHACACACTRYRSRLAWVFRCSFPSLLPSLCSSVTIRPLFWILSSLPPYGGHQTPYKSLVRSTVALVLVLVHAWSLTGQWSVVSGHICD